MPWSLSLGVGWGVGPSCKWDGSIMWHRPLPSALLNFHSHWLEPTSSSSRCCLIFWSHWLLVWGGKGFPLLEWAMWRERHLSTLHTGTHKQMQTVHAFCLSKETSRIFMCVCFKGADVVRLIPRLSSLQLVWATSSHVGCASQLCHRGGDPWEIFACAYSPG